MLAGTIARLEAPATDPLEDTTEASQTLPALAVNSAQADLSGEGVAQHCTLASRVEQDREEPVVYEGGITTDTVPERVEVVSDVIADVRGSGVVAAERVQSSDDLAFPYDMIAAQTDRLVEPIAVDVRGFVDDLKADDALRETWLVGAEDDDGEGVEMAYNAAAEPTDAGKASVGLGFTVSWNGTVGRGVVYRSGYLAIYSSWTAAVYLEFVADTILPNAYTERDDTEQATLPE